MENLKTTKLTMRAASVATLWAFSRLLETRRGKKISKEVDRRIGRAGEQMLSGLNRVSRRATRNRGLTVAALATLAVSVALFSRAATK